MGQEVLAIGQPVIFFFFNTFFQKKIFYLLNFVTEGVWMLNVKFVIAVSFERCVE